MMDYFAHSSAVIDMPCSIGKGTKIWHFTHVMAGATIGADCILGQNVFVGDKVVLGNGVKIQNNVSIYEGVICEDLVFVGPGVVFTNVINPRSAIERKHEFKKTILRKGASVGANATLVCGVEIGEYAFVGAGAVVTKSVLPYALFVGNPAKQVGWISEVGCTLKFDNQGQAICPESKQAYQLLNNNVSKVS